MNIFVVSQMYYPDNFRINEITQQMAADGHNVTVLTGLPDYTTSRIPKEYRWFRRRRETVAGVNVVRVPTVARRSGVLFRMLNYISFVVSGWLYAKFTRQKPDVIYSYETSPVLQVIPAVALHKRRKTPLVIYCCDIWPECLKVWGVGEKSPLFKYMKRVSRDLFNAADRVAITSEPFEEYLTTVNEVPPERLVLMPQHAEDLYCEVAGVYEENGVTDFMFAGNIGAAQDVENIVRAAALLKEKASDPWHIHMVGDGSARAGCEQLAADLGVNDHITFHGKFPPEELLSFYKLADAFLLTLTDSVVGASTLPSKWQGYVSAGKPIAVSCNGISAAITERVDCGLAVPAGDSEGLARIMHEMISDPARSRRQGENGRRYYDEHCTKEKFMTTLYALFDEVCETR